MDLEENLPEKPLHGEFNKGYVSLPFDKDQFKEFISGLLGKPQTITKVIEGVFEFTRDNIINLHSLLQQRIAQQNDSKLIQFNAWIVFSDRSSVLINSIDELITYNEIRPIISTSLHLTWDYLVQFQDKNVPEKQQIDISVISTNEGRIIMDEDNSHVFIARRHYGGYFEFNIKHTARTWGADLEALLTSYFETILKKKSPIKSFISKHSGKISLIIGIVFFVISVGGLYITSKHQLEDTLYSAKVFLEQNKANDVLTLNKKIEFLIEYTLNNSWVNDVFRIVFFIASIILSFVFGSWAETTASRTEPSFILLTQESIKERDNSLKELDKKWLLFIDTVILSIITGIISNYVFYLIMKKN